MMRGSNVDFVALDELTNYLDEQRKKEFVDLVEVMAQAVMQLIIITPDGGYPRTRMLVQPSGLRRSEVSPSRPSPIWALQYSTRCPGVRPC
ncbi:hypothetical protein PQ610_02055 [Tardisphaera miroshnichenkoae]